MLPGDAESGGNDCDLASPGTISSASAKTIGRPI
jgi:hypothetical protein